MKRIVILTGSELRHEFFRKYIALSEEIDVIHAYCEGQEKSLRTKVEQKERGNEQRLKHLSAREQAEEDFFAPFVETIPDRSNPISLPYGAISRSDYTQPIFESRPDLLVAYGCSIVKEPLISAFEGRFLNVHLGLSPYYRGSGTNYWPLVNGEPEYVGATFMYLDPGIDTGDIIHQIRAQYCWGDSPSQIGNRLITEMSRTYRRLIEVFDRLAPMPPLPKTDIDRYYRSDDYTEESVSTLYRNFEQGLIETYLSEERDRCDRVPIVTNPAMEPEQ